MPIEYGTLNKLVAAINNMLVMKGRARMDLFDNDIDPIFEDIRNQNQFFMKQFEKLRNDLSLVQKKVRNGMDDISNLVDDLKNIGDRLFVALQLDRADRRRIYEESGEMKGFPYFSEDLINILDESQKNSISQFYTSIHLYFDRNGVYGHDLRLIHQKIDYAAYIFQEQGRTSIAEFGEELRKLAKGLEVCEREALDHWAHVVRRYIQLRNEFRYKS